MSYWQDADNNADNGDKKDHKGKDNANDKDNANNGADKDHKDKGNADNGADKDHSQRASKPSRAAEAMAAGRGDTVKLLQK